MKLGNIDNRLGALLSRSGLVAAEDVGRALDAGIQRRLPIGKIFVLQGKLSAQDLRLAVDAQWMLRDKMLGEKDAFEAIHLAKRNSWSFTDALIAVGVEANPTKGSRLGELLTQAEILSHRHVKESLDMTRAIELPLGRILIARGVLSEGIVWHAVNLQRSLRKGEISAEQAVDLLVRVVTELQCPNFRIGELLIAAKLIEKAQVEEALRLAASTNKEPESLLVTSGWIAKESLAKAVEAQRLLRLNRLDYSEAVRWLQGDYKTRRTEELRRAAGGDGQATVSLYEFLKLSGYFSHFKMQDFVNKLAQDKRLRTQLVSASGAPAGLTVRKSVELILQESKMLATALSAHYPGERQPLELSKRIVNAINASEMTVESGLLEYADKSRHGAFNGDD